MRGYATPGELPFAPKPISTEPCSSWLLRVAAFDIAERPHMTGTHAPKQLPFVPRPLKDESFSSWLLRVAAENYLSIRELVQGFASVYPGIPLPCSLDRALDSDFLRAFSHFSRTRINSLKALDLDSRLQRPHRALLLRFPAISKSSSFRCCDLRAGYAFCPLCIAQDSVIHVRWDWCFAGLIRCSVHDSPLWLGCQGCGEPDPLTFGSLTSPFRGCRSCGSDLTLRTNRSGEILTSEITAINKAYRDALLSVTPTLTWLGHATSAQFQSFVDDILQLLVRQNHRQQMQHGKGRQSTSVSDQPRLLAVVDLIFNAIPATDRQTRSNRHRRSLKLWTKILSSVHETEVPALRQSSRCWPVPIRARFDHAWAVYERTRLRWRTDLRPYGSPRF